MQWSSILLNTRINIIDCSWNAFRCSCGGKLIFCVYVWNRDKTKNLLWLYLFYWNASLSKQWIIIFPNSIEPNQNENWIEIQMNHIKGWVNTYHFARSLRSSPYISAILSQRYFELDDFCLCLYGSINP